MSKMNFSDLDCSVARSLDAVGDWWSYLIVRDAILGVRRFSDFQRNLDIAKNILSNRLAHLVKEEILEKVDAGEYGRRYEYHLTQKGLDLFPVIIALRQWADKWVCPEKRNILSVRDKQQGKYLPYMAVRDSRGNTLTPRDVISELPEQKITD